LRRRWLIWRHLRHGSPRDGRPIYQVPLCRDAKNSRISKNCPRQKIFTFLPPLETFCLIVRDIAFDVS
jgi:hypothetical protein